MYSYLIMQLFLVLLSSFTIKLYVLLTVKKRTVN